MAQMISYEREGNIFTRLKQLLKRQGFIRSVNIVALIAIVLALPLTLFIASKQQDIRQRASEGTGTTPIGVSLVSTYESIGVYASFTGDTDGNNTAILEWKRDDEGQDKWKRGMDMWGDRRAQILGPKEDIVSNPFVNQWRASVLGLTPHTKYNVRVTFTDSNGQNVVEQTVETRDDRYVSASGVTYYVAPNGTATGCVHEAVFSKIQTAVDCAVAGDNVIVRPGTYSERVTITKDGTANNFITIKAEYPAADGKASSINAGNHAIVDAAANPSNVTQACGTGSGSTANCAFVIYGSFVRVSGFEIINGKVGIKVGETTTGDAAQNVVLDSNYIHNVRFESGKCPCVGILVGKNTDLNNIRNTTITNNTIVAAPGDPAGGGTILFVGTPGGHVIKSNYISFTHPGIKGTHGTDCVSGTPNQGIQGLGHDNDIYNNYCIDSTDEGIEIDGSGMNNRVWNNVLSGNNLGFSIAPVGIGPTYIFRNVVSNLRRHWTESCVGIKTGEGLTGVETGPVYFYHNTFYIPDTQNDCVYVASPDKTIHTSTGIQSNGGGVDSAHVTYKNNIFHGFDFSVKAGEGAILPTLDYNIHYAEDNKGSNIAYGPKNFDFFKDFQNDTCATSCQEAHGHYGRPMYTNVNGTLSQPAYQLFGLANRTPGPNEVDARDKGIELIGFNDSTSAWPSVGLPDIGAFESGTTTVSPTPTPTSVPTIVPATPTTILPTPTIRVVTPTPTPFTILPTATPTPSPLSSIVIFENIGDIVVSTSQVYILWDTNIPATSQVKYGTSPESLTTFTPENKSLVTSHSRKLTGLKTGTRYYYTIISKNAQGVAFSTPIRGVTTKTR